MTSDRHLPAHSLRPFEVTSPTPDGAAVAYRIKIDVPMDWDEDIDDWTLTPEAETLIETTKARHMGVTRRA